MIDLLLSVGCSSLIFVIFKLFKVYGVETLYAIIINYITACTVGLILQGQWVGFSELPGKPWFLAALSLGVLFIIVFNLMAKTSQDLGVSVASVATKMSLAIPVLVGVWLYQEELGAFKILGILLALFAVYFASIKKATRFQRTALLLPGLVFIGSGIIDVAIKYIQNFLVDAPEFPLFSSSVFGAAALTGLVFIGIREPRRFVHYGSKNIVAGIALGVPNFFSIYFLLRALNTPKLASATIFTLNNTGIVMFTTLLGILLFQEKLSRTNWLGIMLAIISILLVALL